MNRLRLPLKSWALFIVVTASLPVHAVGFMRLAPSAEQPLDIGIWYPSEAPVPAVPNTPFGQALAIDGEPVGNDLPLVVLSHGNAGWMGSHADTALALADAGYVATAITHSDDNTRNEGVSPSLWMLSRPAEVISSIEYVLQDWSGASHVSAERIGVFGFSAGGYTALLAAGAVPDIDLAVEHCARQPTEFLCVIGLVDEISNGNLSADSPVFASDSRIMAVSVAAPAFAFAFDDTALAAIDGPVQIWSASLDERVPHATNGGMLAAALSEESEVEVELVENAGHFAFLMPCDPAQKNSNPQIWQMVCEDAPGFDRAEFHLTFNRKVVDFLDRALAR